METLENAQQLLFKLRKAAEAKEAHDCEMALRGLGELLGKRFMLECAIEQLGWILPEFEKYNPNLAWLYTWLSSAQEFNPATYLSLEGQIQHEESILPYPQNALEAFTHYLVIALEDLNMVLQEVLQDYILDDVKGSNLAGVTASYFAMLFRSQIAIYQHQNCPEAFTGYMNLLNRELTEDFSKLSKEELQEFSAVQKASRSCAKATPYTFWFNLADDIEKRLAPSLAS